MRRTAVRVLLPAVLLLATLAAGVVLWGWSQFGTQGPLKAPATVILDPGLGLQGIARRLEEGGVIGSATVFAAGVRLAGAHHRLRAGEYAFEPGVSPRAVMDELVAGVVVVHRLTLPEGLSSAEIVALVGAAPALTGEIAGPVPEGSLLPDTYHYVYGDDRAQLIVRMQVAMQAALDELWPARADGLPFASPEDAVTLASIVEKETGLAGERALVAGVFVNRLRVDMPLQSDPTVVYALSRGGVVLDRPLRRFDLEVDDPYNTYRHRGLPPGPIANPGRAALEATLHPAETGAYYFVADGTGGHAFAATLDEHNANVRRYRDMLSGGVP
jgi:UPF0755 protein